MKVRSSVILSALLLAAWLPLQAQQAATPSAPAPAQQSPAPAADKPSNAAPKQACCCAAKGAPSADAPMAHDGCCHGKMAADAKSSCCTGKDAKDMPCCAPQDKTNAAAMPCCQGMKDGQCSAKDGKSCCEKMSAKGGKGCCPGMGAQCPAHASGK